MTRIMQPVSPARTPGALPRRNAKPATDYNSAPNHLWRSLTLRPQEMQTKLTVSQPGDLYEQEADRVAEQVMRRTDSGERATAPSLTSGALPGTLQRQCDICLEEEEDRLQRKESLSNGAEVGLVPTSSQETLSSPGQPLSAGTRAFFEPRFRRDFGDVRVHTDARAAESARAVNGLAYTVGTDIVFGQNQYAPHTSAGKGLLAHELAHVTQQTAGGLAIDQTDQNGLAAVPPQAEQAADATAAAILSGENAPAQPGQSVQVARQFHPAPAPPVFPPSPAPPVMPEKEETESPARPAPDKDKAPSKQRAPVGKSGIFKEDSPTAALRRWDYVVYQDHVRLGNRKVDDTPGGPVIGSWPWMTNNPGDLTGDLNPRQENPNDAASAYRQDKRIWGNPILRGKTPANLQPVAGSSGLSADNTAVAAVAARRDLAIFADRERGRRALKEWIEKYYGKFTLAESVKLHLGPASSHVAGVDDPEKYPKLLQQYLSDKGYPADYVGKTKGADVKPEAWNDVVDAFGFAEGFYNRRAVAGQAGKFQYIENKGIIYRCAGRDPIDVDPTYGSLARVKNMPQDTPPEIKDLLGCE